MSREKLRSMIDGYRQTCLLAAASRLCLFECIGNGSMHVDSLAELTGSSPEPMMRLLRALRALGIVDISGQSGRIVRLTPTGVLLLEKDLQQELNLVSSEYLPSWAELGRVRVDGQPLAPRALAGGVWEHRKESVVAGRAFNERMRASQAAAVVELVQRHKLEPARFKTVVDVGGGYGQLLVGLLLAAPRSEGVLFDLPHVVADAEKEFLPHIHPEVRGRVRTVGGSFFDSVPRGGDLYVLRNVLHDWDDYQCKRILSAVKEAMAPGSLLLVMEPATENPMLDVHLMVMHGGALRHPEQLGKLLMDSGFMVSGSRGPGVLECLSL